MLVRVLGAVEVVDESTGDVVDLGRRRQRELLVLLTARLDEVVPEDWLVEAMWPDGDLPEHPRRSLQTYVSRLRSILGADSLASEAPGYRLAVDTDASRFERAVRNGRATGDVAGLRAALDMWRGEPYGEFGDRIEVLAQVRHLRDLRHDATETLGELLVAADDVSDAAARLQRVVDDAPDRERAVRLAMLALYRSGRQPDALRVYQTHRAALAESGLEPSGPLTELEQRIVARDPSLDEPSGRRLGSYELFEEIGEGAFGSIYRASQPAVDREVAIKVVRAELANDPDFVKRFEREALTVARLEHPHIVPLHDFWRDPSGAYLVMRYLRGGSAEQRLVRDGPMGLDQVAQLVDQVGAALAVAHESGVVHRDVKPANILFDEADNAYLADFGIAVDAGRAAELDLASAGSPLYVAPEQVRDGEATAASDIYAFGVVLFELLTGVAPFGDSDSMEALLTRKLRERVPSLSEHRPDLPAGVDAVIQTATAPVADGRFPSMSEMVLAFRAAVSTALAGADTTSAVLERPRAAAGQTLVALEMETANPYMGLAAFGEADAGHFFGRAELSDELVSRLAESRFVVVTGPSGSGKSSVVRAGVTPRLRDLGRYVVSIVPGAHPFDEIETALQRIAIGPTGALLDQLTADPRGLVRAVKRVLPEPEGELVVVVDQFEELFTLTDVDTRDAFLASLEAAVADERSQVRVVCTLRADFYDRPLQHGAIARLVRDNTVAVTPLSGEELEAAITQPAAQVGVVAEPALVAELVGDIRGQAAALPLLQYALTEVYDRRDGGRMTLDAYRRIGGISGALANRADEIAGQVDETAVRRLFTRLVTPGEGTEDTRRRVLRSDLGVVAGDVIDRFGEARLLTFDHEPVTREPTVEIAHEAIIREWPRLRAWLDEDRTGLLILRHLGDTAEAWQASGREAGELYRGGRLESAEEWASVRGDELTDTEASFLAASVEQRTIAQAQERRRVRRLRSLLVATAIVAAVALIAGAVAFQQRGRADDQAAAAEAAAADAVAARELAEDQTDLAVANAQAAEEAARGESSARAAGETRRMLAEAAILKDENPTLALLLAREAYEREPGPATLGAVFNAISREDGYLGSATVQGVTNRAWVSFLDDDTIVVRDGATIQLVDAHTRDVRVRHESPGAVKNLGWPIAHDNAGRFVTITEAGGVLYVDSGDDTVHTLALPPDRRATGAGVASDGSIAVGYADGGIELFVGPTLGNRIPVGAHPHPVEYVVADREAEISLAVDQRGNITLWDLDTGEPRWTWTIGIDPITSLAAPLQTGAGETGEPEVLGLKTGGPVAIDTDTVIATGRPLAMSADGSTVFSLAAGVMAMDAETGQPLWRLGSNNSGESEQFEVLSDGRVLFGRTILQDGDAVRVFEQLDSNAHTSVSDSGDVMVVSGSDRVEFWSLDGDQLIGQAIARGTDDYATVGPDGEIVVSLQYGGAVEDRQGARLRRASTGQLVDSDAQGAWMAGYTRAGDFMSYYAPGIGSQDYPGRTIVMRDETTYTPIGSPPEPQTWGAFELSPDGSILAVGDIFGPSIRLYDNETGRLVRTLTDPMPQDSNSGIFSLMFSADGRWLAATPLGPTAPVVLWDTATWEAELVLEPSGDDVYFGVAFSTDGHVLAVGVLSGGVVLYDLEARELRGTVGAGSPGPTGVYHVNGLEFSHDDRYLITSRSIIDVESGQLIGRPGGDGNNLAFGPSVAPGGRFRVTDIGEQLLVQNLDVDSWPDIACHAAGRNMTADEWERFGPVGGPYRATCPQWEALG